MKILKLTLGILLCGIMVASLVFAGEQAPGQAEGQAAAIARTLVDTGPRSFTGAYLAKFNLPLAGIGTGIIYFNGGAKPARWDIGTLGDTTLMADHSLFAVSVYNGGSWTTKKLQTGISNAFDNQPTNSTRTTFNKQGNYFIGTCEVPPSSWDDTKTGTLESDTFTMPSTCSKITALIGGGNHLDTTYLALVDASNGAELAKLTGANSDAMTTQTMNIGTQYAGRNVFFRIVDNYTGGWGHIDVDYIQLKNSSDQVVSSTFQNGDFETGNLTGWKIIGGGDYGSPVVISEYPIVKYRFTDPSAVVDAELEVFNPMIPTNERDSIIPTGIFNIKLTNRTANSVNVSVLSSLANGLKGTSRTNTAYSDTYGKYVTMNSSGFTDGTMEEGSLCLWTGATGATYCAGVATVNDLITQLNSSGALNGTTSGNAAIPVAGVCAPVTLAAGETKTVSFSWSWYFPHMKGSNIWGGDNTDVSRRYVNYYTNVTTVMQDVMNRWSSLVDNTKLYHDTMYDSNLPYYFIDAVTNTTDIMRSPTFFNTKNGELYAWEGSDSSGGGGCCYGNCMHVWNYVEAITNLYPDLARRWKTLDFTKQQNANGLLNNRIGAIPAPSSPSGEGVAIDGTLGTIAGAYREHLNSPDNTFLDSLWTRIKNAMEGAIAIWDPNHDGVNENTANTTYDEAVYGEFTFTAGQYLAALLAAEKMARIKGDTTAADFYHNLFTSGSAKLNLDTYNGEYYYQVGGTQFGPGMLNDHLLGQAYAFRDRLGYLLPEDRVRSSIGSVFKYNFFSPVGSYYHGRVFALPDDDALLICTFPNGGSGTNVYCGEDMTGFDYTTVASLLYLGLTDQALTIVHGIRSRYDGKDFDPLNEIECGGYYGRAMSSYGILNAALGIEKNGPQKLIGFKPNLNQNNLKAFFAYVNGWGTFEQTRSVNGNVTTQVDRLTVKYGGMTLWTLQFYYPDSLLQRLTTVQSTVKLNGGTVSATQTVTGNQVKLTLASDTQVNAGSNLETTITITDNGPGPTWTPTPSATPTPSPTPMPTSMSFSDDFNDGNLTGWTVVSGTWTNPGTVAQGVSTGDGFIMRSETGNNFTYEADIKLVTSGAAGILIFRSNSNASSSYAVALDSTTNVIKFYKFPYVSLQTYSQTFTIGTWYHLKVVTAGSNVKIYFNGATTPCIDCNDLSYASGQYGMAAWGGTAQLDNLVAGPTGGTPTPTPTPTATPSPTPAATPTFAPGNIFGDNFNDGDLAGWTVVSGIWTNPGAEAQGVSTGDGFIMRSETGNDFIYEADLELVTAGSAGILIFRSNYNASSSYAVALDSTSGYVKFYKFPYVSLQTYNYTFTIGTWYHLKVVAAGTNFKIYFNNSPTPCIDCNDSTYTSGQFGMAAWGGAAQLDNVKANGPVNVFYDGFESNNFTAGGWTNSGCTLGSTYKYAGTYAAIMNSSDSLTKARSTAGYQNIQVSYARYTRNCTSSCHFIAEWYNGSAWTALEDVTGNFSWTVKTWNLPVEANNNANLQIRFRTSGNGSGNYAYLDEVKLIGIPQ